MWYSSIYKGMFILAAALLTLWGCAKSELELSTAHDDIEGRAVAFDFSCVGFSGEVGTRAPAEMKSFPNGAVIHVTATFQFKDGHTEGDYACFTYSGETGKWVPQGDGMVWPLYATGGSFEGFYVPGIAQELTFDETSEGTSEVMNLGDITDVDGENSEHYATDPLHAVCDMKDYGSKVSLRFNHVCTRLLLADVGKNDEKLYRLIHKTGDLKNAYVFSVKREPVEGHDGKYTYAPQIKFVSDDSRKDKEGNLYVYGRLVRDELKGDEIESACFYLAPGKYKGAHIHYHDDRPFVTLNIDKLDKPDDVSEEGLKANVSYTVDILLDPGVVNDEVLAKEAEWPELSNPLGVNIVSFLQAMANGTEYEEEIDGTCYHIIEKEGTTRCLRYDIDFKQQDTYQLFQNAGIDYPKFGCPDFDGGNHSFVNVAKPLFSSMASGNLRNLALREVNIKIGQYNGNEIKELAVGCIAGVNSGCAVSNILLDNVKIKAKLYNVNTAGGTSNIVNYHVGGVFGNYSSGSLSEIHLKQGSSLEVTVEGDNGYMDDNLYVGGICGSSFQDLKQVDVYYPEDGSGNENPKIIVKSTVGQSKTDLTYLSSIGGIVGHAFGNLSDIELSGCTMEVDASQSVAGNSYAGGIAGTGDRAMDNGQTATSVMSKIENSSVNATVKGGMATPTQSTSGGSEMIVGRSYTGGLVGRLSSYNLSDCLFVGSVYAGQRDTSEGNNEFVRLALGGGVGAVADNITTAEADKSYYSHVYSCTVWAKLEGVYSPYPETRYWCGSFIGLQNQPNVMYNYDYTTSSVACPKRQDEAVGDRTDKNGKTVLNCPETYPVNTNYGNINRSSNDGYPFCGAFIDDTFNEVS